MLLVLLAGPVTAQRDAEWDRNIVSQVRIDARDLGYSPKDVIPDGESEIRSLTVAPNGVLYGATSGKRSHLFALYPSHGYVQPLGYIPGVTQVTNALVVSKNGDVFIGAGLPSGHLFRYKPDQDDLKPIRIHEPATVEDLGMPVPGQGIRALAINREAGVIYGVTWPDGLVFARYTGSDKFQVLGKVAEKNMPGEKFEHDKNIAGAIGILNSGSAWLSGEDGALYFAVPSELHKLDIGAPTVPGREPFNRVDAWTTGRDGSLYGGTSDGYLFRILRPDTVENRGKPLNQYRIRGLVTAPDGRLYGVGGDDDEMARLFSYDPRTGVYEMLGMIDVNRRPYYSWQAYVIGAMAIGLDGTIYLGQAERKSMLYLYHPTFPQP